MNKDTLKGQWNQVKGKAREEWGKLTNDDLDVVKGNYEQLVGIVQERYGEAREKAQAQVDKWLQRQQPTGTTGTSGTPRT